MNIIQQIATGSACYRCGGRINIKGLMLHSVGCNQPKAEVFANIWNRSNDVCCHGLVDAEKAIQTLPWNYRGWHCGESGNNTHIGIEMTEPSQIHYVGGCTFTCDNVPAAREHVRRTYDNAVELFAFLCTKYGLNPLTDICSHNEGAQRGIASRHSDPEHLWNQLGMGYTMDGFRHDVVAKMNGTNITHVNKDVAAKQIYRIRTSYEDVKSQVGAYSNLENAIKLCTVPYKVFDWDGNCVHSSLGDATEKPKVDNTSTQEAQRGANPVLVWDFKYDEKIKELQQILANKGCNIGIDGIAGNETYNAVKKYTIEMYDRGQLTKWVQERLNSMGFDCGYADGYAEPPTMNGIAKFQKQFGLGVGFFGGNDWYYLIR